MILKGVVITGPGNAESALKAFLDYARPNIASHVLALETIEDLPAAETLHALGRRYCADPTLSAANKLRATLNQPR
jgi:hypothetical protein